MSTNVTINQKIDNLNNTEIWPVKLLIFSLKECVSLVLHRISMISVSKSKLGCALLKIKKYGNSNNKFLSYCLLNVGRFLGHTVDDILGMIGLNGRISI